MLLVIVIVVVVHLNHQTTEVCPSPAQSQPATSYLSDAAATRALQWQQPGLGSMAVG